MDRMKRFQVVTLWELNLLGTKPTDTHKSDKIGPLNLWERRFLQNRMKTIMDLNRLQILDSFKAGSKNILYRTCVILQTIGVPLNPSEIGTDSNN